MPQFLALVRAEDTGQGGGGLGRHWGTRGCCISLGALVTRTRGARDTCCITPAGNTGTGHAGKLSWVHMWRAWRNAGPAAGQAPLLPLVTGLLPISGLISLHTVHDFVPDYPESSYRRVHLPEYTTVALLSPDHLRVWVWEALSIRRCVWFVTL